MISIRSRLLVGATIAATAAAVLTSCASSGTGDSASPADGAAAFPEKQITIIVPGPAGSAHDSIARIIGEGLSDDLGANVVVQNAGTEAQGMIDVRDADPDGYTLGLAPSGPIALIPMWTDNGYDGGTTDYDIVAQVDSSPIVLLVRDDSPFKDLEDFVEATRGDTPVKVGGSAGKGYPALGQAMLAELADATNYVNVGFPPGEQIVAGLNGSVDAVTAATPLASQYVASGEMRVLTTFYDEKVPGFDAPLAIDDGYDVNASPVHMMYAPKGTPAEIVELLSDSLETVVASEKFQEFAASAYIVPSFLNAEDATAVIDEEVENARRISKNLGWEVR